MFILLLLPFSLVYGYSLPFNQQESCLNVLDDTCNKLNVHGNSLSESMWAGNLNRELQPGSMGLKIEEKYYEDQLELLTNEKYQTLPYVKDLQSLYKSCLNYKKSDLYNSPLVEKIFRACGGDAIFNPEVEIENDIEQVMADVIRNFGADSAFIIPFGDDLQMNTILFYEFKDMNRVYKKLYNGSEPDSKISNIFDQISKLQYDIKHGDYRHGLTSYTKSQLKTKLENHTVDWVKYVELSVMIKNFTIKVNMDDFKIRDEVVKKYGKRTFLGYIFFSALKFIEYELGDINYGEEGHQFTEPECLKMVSSAQMPFFAQYYKIHNDKQKEESIERSAEELRSQMIEMVGDSKRISEKTKKYILGKLSSLKIFAQYPSTLKDDKMIEGYMKELNFEMNETFFEKMASIFGANFRYAYKFYSENSRENFIWSAQSSVDHKLNYLVYKAESNSIVVKKIMQDDIFYDMSRIPSFQILDWYVAEALAYAVVRYNAESQILEDFENRQSFASCMQIARKSTFEVQNIYIQLALTVFYKRQHKSGQTLRKFFDAFIATQCGVIDNDDWLVYYRQKHYSSLKKSLANLIDFSTTYQCDRNQTEVCSLL